MALWPSGTESGEEKLLLVLEEAIDFGAKRNILRCLADQGAKVTVLPATATAAEVLSLPMYPELSQFQIETVVTSIKRESYVA